MKFRRKRDWANKEGLQVMREGSGDRTVLVAGGSHDACGWRRFQAEVTTTGRRSGTRKVRDRDLGRPALF